MMEIDVQPVLSQYSIQYRPHCIDRWENAGFSGALIDRCQTPAGLYCLRGWPRGGLPLERLRGLHRLLAEVHHRGVTEVAVPVSTVQGSSLVEFGSRYWQLEPWMPGRADFWQDSNARRLRAAMTCLARWHAAAAEFQPLAVECSWFAGSGDAQSPAVLERLEQVQRFLRTDCRKIRDAMRQSEPNDFRDQAQRCLDLFDRTAPPIADELRIASQLRFPLQPCLRDVWHDHLLFTGDDVTGLIDAGACRCENVAADLARLVGSLVEDDRDAWDAALAAYQELRPLSLNERGLVRTLDRSGVLLSGMAWLDRRFLRGQTFAQPERVRERMWKIVSRLEHLARSV